MSYYPTFKDGKRTIDYILVYKISTLLTEGNEIKQKNFLNSLQVLGLQLESETFSVDDNVVFLKIHAPDEFILSYADLFDIDLTFQNTEFRPVVKPPRRFLASPLTRPNINDPIYSRASETVSGDMPTKATSAERIMVVNQILQRSVWGQGKSDYGIHKLLSLGIFTDAFPLHDGSCEWTVTGPLNDRQLLSLYWGSMSCWRKAQPINLVEKYFGTEYAMYFAWLGMYIKHLIPAAILSVVVLLYGIATMFSKLNNHAHQICASHRVMCPRCHFAKCPMELLSNSCYFARMNYIFDNWCAVVFSVIMCIWGSAIKCWDCLSDADSKFAYPFDNKTLAITSDQVKLIQ